jgi:hypothetical protein
MNEPPAERKAVKPRTEEERLQSMVAMTENLSRAFDQAIGSCLGPSPRGTDGAALIAVLQYMTRKAKEHFPNKGLHETADVLTDSLWECQTMPGAPPGVRQ